MYTEVINNIGRLNKNMLKPTVYAKRVDRFDSSISIDSRLKPVAIEAIYTEDGFKIRLYSIDPIADRSLYKIVIDKNTGERIYYTDVSIYGLNDMYDELIYDTSKPIVIGLSD